MIFKYHLEMNIFLKDDLAPYIRKNELKTDNQCDLKLKLIYLLPLNFH